MEFLFPTVDVDENVDQSVDAVSTSHIIITTLSGEPITLVYNPDQTIMSVKDIVETDLNIPFNKQRLLFNDIELKVCKVCISLYIPVKIIIEIFIVFRDLARISKLPVQKCCTSAALPPPPPKNYFVSLEII